MGGLLDCTGLGVNFTRIQIKYFRKQKTNSASRRPGSAQAPGASDLLTGDSDPTAQFAEIRSSAPSWPVFITVTKRDTFREQAAKVRCILNLSPAHFNSLLSFYRKLFSISKPGNPSPPKPPVLPEIIGS